MTELLNNLTIDELQDLMIEIQDKLTTMNVQLIEYVQGENKFVFMELDDENI